MNNVGWISIIKAGWPVLSVLLVGSILTVAVVLERWKAFRFIQKNSDLFFESLKRSQDTNKLIQWCEQSEQPLALITGAIYKTPSTRPDKERALQKSIQKLVRKYESHVSLLGTIASVAPFVGLLGTVIGIIKAFRAVSMASTAGASLVAVGIAEALVGTAAGLIVAIPALLAYNYFANRIRRLTQEWELVGSDIIDLSLSIKG
ncbi:hypothetical protein BVX98_06465 [bacterium F11]|nr:hypothetical protein BVX98_06465 [bacterium F11]